MWKCARCSEVIEDQFEKCWKCGVARASGMEIETAESSVRPTLQMETDSGGQPSISIATTRYSDAYRVAKGIIAQGNSVKKLAVGLGVVIVIGSIFAAWAVKTPLIVAGGVVIALVLGYNLYLVGVLIVAQGQLLLATLDTAVNTSALLSERDREAAIAR
jgi:hypothetical protein